MNLALGWLRGPEFVMVESTCPWASRPGSCGMRVIQLGARACAETTDYRRSAEMRRQLMPCTCTPNSDSAN